jgi:hypothetical protein
MSERMIDIKRLAIQTAHSAESLHQFELLGEKPSVRP